MVCALGETYNGKIPEINLVFVVVYVDFSFGTSSSNSPKLTVMVSRSHAIRLPGD